MNGCCLFTLCFLLHDKRRETIHIAIVVVNVQMDTVTVLITYLHIMADFYLIEYLNQMVFCVVRKLVMKSGSCFGAKQLR